MHPVNQERRSLPRPHPGELRTCPKCKQMMRFDERYTVTHGRISDTNPAWICLNRRCGHEERVRKEDE